MYSPQISKPNPFSMTYRYSGNTIEKGHWGAEYIRSCWSYWERCYPMIVRGGAYPGVVSDDEQDKGNDDDVERRHLGKLHSDFTATSPCCEACRRSNSQSAVTVTAKSLHCSGSTTWNCLGSWPAVTCQTPLCAEGSRGHLHRSLIELRLMSA